MTDRWRDEERYRRGSGSDYRGSDYDRGYSSDEERRYSGSESGGYGREESSGREYGQRRTGSGYGREDEYDRDWDRGYTGSGSYERQGGGYGRQRRGAYSGYSEPSRGREDRSWWERTGDEVRSWFGDEDAERRRREDEHRGRGPKGYTRSDDRIREDVCDRLSDDPRLDASDIEVMVSEGEVTLTGTVSARDAKRRAEDCAEDVSGVKNVQNNLRVQQQMAGASELGGTTGASSMAGGSTGAASTTTGGKTRQGV